MTTYEVHPIGKICSSEGETYIQIDPEFIPAMQALEGFSHIQVIWWFSDFDTQEARSVLEVDKPYKQAPEKMGIFATRSPVRPNPVALTPAEVLEIDRKQGIIRIAYSDANNNSPVIDIKPYTPSFDRIESAEVPGWCAHWPKSLEESADFAWENEFNF